MRVPVLPFLLFAAPALAGPDIRALLVEAARQSDCAFTEDQAEVLFRPLGLGPSDVSPVAQAMVAAGEATVEGNVLRLSPALCAATGTPPAEPAEPAEAMIRMLRENGCRLTQDEARPLLGQYGLTMETADEVADSLMDRNLAREEGEALVLQDCPG